MATKIYNTTTNEVVEAEVKIDGQDFLFETMAQYGVEPSDRDDAEFELDQEETEWWLRYAEREQGIMDAANEAGEVMLEAIARISAEYSDLEALQDRLEGFLGIG